MSPQVSDGPKMDDLPTEILRTIASFTPAECVVRLCAVNRTLRQACNDAIVFRSCLEVNASALEHTDVASSLPNIEILSEVFQNNTQAWARVAAANSLASKWFKYFDVDTIPGKELPINVELSRHYVPHLLVMGHPWLYIQVVTKACSALVNLKGDLYASHLDTPYIHMSNRRITRQATLEQRHRNLNDFMNTSESAFWWCVAAFSDQRFGREDFVSEMQYSFIARCSRADFGKADLTSTMSTLVTWGWVLKDYLEALTMTRGNQQPSDGPAARLVPRTEDLPWFGKLGEGKKIPMPFMSGKDFHLKHDSNYLLVAWDEWLQSTVAEMSRPENLAKSSWCGYWSFHRRDLRDMEEIEYADAVEGLNIHAMHQVDYPVHDSRRIVGTYSEHTIDFHLEGYITPHGRFRLGPPGDFWCWMGWMTPWGLFGFWGSADGDQAAGACWLWQESWTEETNKQRGARGNRDVASSASAA